MKDSSKVILVGMFSEILELCRESGKEVIGFIDNAIPDTSPNINYLGTDADAEKLYRSFREVPLIICPDNPNRRASLAKYYGNIGFAFCNLIHPSVRLSRSSKLGNGNIIQYQTNISSDVEISNFVRVNCFSNIMHECKIGIYTTIAPNSVLLGRVVIGDLCYIGANSTILPNLKIGSKTIIGAGAVVTKNIKENCVVTGNPAKESKKNIS
jgi:sugar O-acyltransferase (sialic acid O-acetyltransferase NeuD family)